MIIAPIVSADLENVAYLQEEGWSDIRVAFSRYIEEPFSHPIKIEIDNKLVGVGATIVHGDIAWLGHIIVHPSYRSKGLGKIITQTLVGIAKENNCQTTYLLATELGAPVYEKVGFVTETTYCIFTDITISQKIPISSHIQPYSADFRKEVAELDQQTSSENRFFYLEKFLGDMWIYVNKNRVEGYYIPTLENGPIIAKTENAGLALVSLHLKDHQQLIFPKDNTILLQFLNSNNHKESSSCKRMRFGDWKPTNMAHIYNRIAGYLG